ncbi:hypothetical protein MPTK1_4g05200 [Marchantia polymorpha subsp. ruderalis]|uniref:Uncharacterized protein n=2 Tax=Marchantia polymorpha TaxID=3197 RepID=A0AAF6B6K0_MARPO|nr:hypothetical protein MARPO_0087s0069 [Marchantia polymorpha]BBN07634.1 hypothetical protein Mp_4g05200 [Marchantia polymorpha subsp. ruderalis]|eukprot:PTQ33638.1 hypothetical protein MARPO_0087s0069 [Marchantia polymorpha]
MSRLGINKLQLQDSSSPSSRKPFEPPEGSHGEADMVKSDSHLMDDTSCLERSQKNRLTFVALRQPPYTSGKMLGHPKHHCEEICCGAPWNCFCSLYIKSKTESTGFISLVLNLRPLTSSWVTHGRNSSAINSCAR